jgi:hypothetical protein
VDAAASCGLCFGASAAGPTSSSGSVSNCSAGSTLPEHPRLRPTPPSTCSPTPARPRALQGVLTNGRVRLLMSAGQQGFRGNGRRKGERRRKSVRGCIVSPDLASLNLVIVKKGEADLPGECHAGTAACGWLLLCGSVLLRFDQVDAWQWAMPGHCCM